MTSVPKLISIFHILFRFYCCICNGSLNLIGFILAHVILYFVTHVPVSLPSLSK